MDVNEIIERQEEIEKRNDEYLEEFENDLRKDFLTDKTVKNHVSNVSLYLNEYLLLSCDELMQAGCDEEHLDDFFGYFLARKSGFSKDMLKQMVASVKKFYKCMDKLGYIQEGECKKLLDHVKENLEIWQDACDEEF